MEECYLSILSSKHKLTFVAPLEKCDHPGLDTSKCAHQDGIQKCQSLIGFIQWAVSLGTLDFNAAVVTLAFVRAELREGHLDRSRRVVSYLVKFKHTTVRIRTEEPELSSMPITPYE